MTRKLHSVLMYKQTGVQTGECTAVHSRITRRSVALRGAAALYTLGGTGSLALPEVRVAQQGQPTRRYHQQAAAAAAAAARHTGGHFTHTLQYWDIFSYLFCLLFIDFIQL